MKRSDESWEEDIRGKRTLEGGEKRSVGMRRGPGIAGACGRFAGGTCALNGGAVDWISF